MATYTKSDLLYKDYFWSTDYTNNVPCVTGIPDAIILSRKEGYEILYFINKFAEKHELDTAECIAAEYKIRNELPSYVRSQIDIQYWIEINWNK